MGSPKSPETRARMSESARKRSPEHLAKIARSLTGRIFSETHRANISKALRGQKLGPLTPEHRAKLSAARKGTYNARNARVIGECAYCLKPAKTMDHMVPRSRGGTDDPSNLVPACWSCNASKHDNTVEEWFGVPPGAYSPTRNFNDEIWVVVLSRYHRDNLLRLLNGIGWPYYLPGKYPEKSPLIDPKLEGWNSGDWVGEIALKLARLDGATNCDELDHPNTHR